MNGIQKGYSRLFTATEDHECRLRFFLFLLQEAKRSKWDVCLAPLFHELKTKEKNIC
jgi:hypothetical protein